MADMPKPTAQDEAMARADLKTQPLGVGEATVDLGKAIEGWAQQYRDSGLVHGQSAAVVSTAKALVDVAERDAEALIHRFHELTGFAKDALKAEIERIRAAKQPG